MIFFPFKDLRFSQIQFEIDLKIEKIVQCVLKIERTII